MRYTKEGFSIIEVLVGIFIFSLGLVSIYALLISSLQISDYNRNAIIASNLAREQIELIRNIRDTNYAKVKVFDQIDPNEVFSPTTQTFSVGSYYTIENNFNPGATFNTKLQDISLGFVEGESNLSDPGMLRYRVCKNTSTSLYEICDGGSDQEETVFYKYIFLEEAKYDDGTVIPDAYLITSKVIWFKRGYHEFDIKTLITDWRRI